MIPKLLSRLDYESWGRGLLGDFLKAGARAAESAIAVMVIDPKDFNIYTRKVYLVLGAVFLFNGLRAVLHYISEKPLPEKVVETTVRTIESENRPPVTVTTQKETHKETIEQKKESEG